MATSDLFGVWLLLRGCNMTFGEFEAILAFDPVI